MIDITDRTLEEARIEFESLARIAKAMLQDAERVVTHGDQQELTELEEWIRTSPTPSPVWDFETTCHIVKQDEHKWRKKLTMMINVRKAVEHRL